MIKKWGISLRKYSPFIGFRLDSDYVQTGVVSPSYQPPLRSFLRHIVLHWIGDELWWFAAVTKWISNRRIATKTWLLPHVSPFPHYIRPSCQQLMAALSRHSTLPSRHRPMTARWHGATRPSRHRPMTALSHDATRPSRHRPMTSLYLSSNYSTTPSTSDRSMVPCFINIVPLTTDESTMPSYDPTSTSPVDGYAVSLKNPSIYEYIVTKWTGIVVPTNDVTQLVRVKSPRFLFGAKFCLSSFD